MSELNIVAGPTLAVLLAKYGDRDEATFVIAVPTDDEKTTVNRDISIKVTALEHRPSNRLGAHNFKGWATIAGEAILVTGFYVPAQSPDGPAKGIIDANERGLMYLLKK